MSLKSKVHSAYEKTPFELVFETEMRIESETEDKKLIKSARSKLKKYQETVRATQNKNARRKIKELSAGDIDFLKGEGLLNKMDKRFKALFEVLGKTRRGNYQIVDTHSLILDKIPSKKMKLLNKESFGKVKKVFGGRKSGEKIELLLIMRFQQSVDAQWWHEENFVYEICVQEYLQSLPERKLRRNGALLWL